MNKDKFTIELLPCLQDNYAFILVNHMDQSCYVIDTPDGDKIGDWLLDRNLLLRGILNTHHHHDHVGGNNVLKKRFECSVWGAAKDADRITGITHTVQEYETLSLFDGTLTAEIIALDGHTIGLIAYYIPDIKALFVGDALFNLGCGYMFEGTAEIMWQSMTKIKALPDDTLIYAAHEYSLKNAEFVTHIMPFSLERHDYIEALKITRQNGNPTIPTLLSDQKKFNPFLNADHNAVKQATHTMTKGDADTFGILREMKNNFS